MSGEDRMKTALADLVARDVSISAFLVICKDGKKQLLGYDDKGLVNFVSDKVDKLTFYQNNPGGGMHTMGSLGEFPKTAEPEPEPEPEPEDEKTALKRNQLDDV